MMCLLPEIKMKRIFALALLFGVSFLHAGAAEKTEVLVYTHNGPTLDGKAGYVHDNIAACVKAIEKIGAQNGFGVVHSDNPGVFTNSALKHYRAIIFANSNNKAFDNEQERKAFQDYIHSGGGFVGIHSATGSERDWPWFWKLIGGSFSWHAPLQTFTIQIKDHQHPATAFFKQDTWDWEDEFYVMKEQPNHLQVLLEGNIKKLKGVDQGKLKALEKVAADVNSSDPIKIGETLHIVFSDTASPVPAMNTKVREDGTITLMFNQTFHVLGKKPADLAEEIRQRFVPDYYFKLNATVMQGLGPPPTAAFTDFSRKRSSGSGTNSEAIMVPLAWYHEFEGARSFYTALGHKKEYYSDPNFVKHLTGGILWAMREDTR